MIFCNLSEIEKFLCQVDVVMLDSTLDFWVQMSYDVSCDKIVLASSQSESEILLKFT